MENIFHQTCKLLLSNKEYIRKREVKLDFNWYGYSQLQPVTMLYETVWTRWPYVAHLHTYTIPMLHTYSEWHLVYIHLIRKAKKSQSSIDRYTGVNGTEMCLQTKS